MKNLNKPQTYLAILTLILGLAYMLFKPANLSNENIKTDSIQESKVSTEEPKNLKQDLSSNIEDNADQDFTSNQQLTKERSLAISKWQTQSNNSNVNVYFVNAPELPMVDIEITFSAGSAYESEKPGLAALTNAMLLEGTKDRNTDQINDALESVGAKINTNISRDKASVTLRSLTDQNKLNVALNILNDIIAHSIFPSKNLNRVKNKAIEQLKLDEQYPEEISIKTFYKTVYKSHPYAIPINGTIDSVGKINSQDLLRFYKKYYVVNNAQIAMVGALDEAQAKTITENIAKHLNSLTQEGSLPDVPKTTTASTQHIEFPSTQTHILVGTIGIKRNDPDYFALTVGNHILGKMPLTSLLFKNVRIDNGLAYSIYSQFVPMKDMGPFLISMQTRNEKANEALKISTDVLSNFIKNGPSEQELTLAKQNLTGQFPLNIASNSNKLSVISSIGYYKLPLNYLDTYIDNINKITAEDIKSAFNKHINLNQLIIVTVGNNKHNLVTEN